MTSPTTTRDPSKFSDRRQAGRELAKRLSHYAGREDVLVLGLPRGGVPVGYEIANSLGAPLDVFIVRKLGVPGHEELAMGAIATGGIMVLDSALIRNLGLSSQGVQHVVEAEKRELERREKIFRAGRPALHVMGKTIILVDDGLATGATMRAAVKALKTQMPARMVIAVPVAAMETCESFRGEVDEVICAQTPEHFYAVGLWYEDFSQTTDREVGELLTGAPSVK